MEVSGEIGVVAVMDLGRDGDIIGVLSVLGEVFVGWYEVVVFLIRDAREVESTQPS